MKNQIYLIFATAIGWNIRVYMIMYWCFAFFFYWAWIKLKNAPLVLVGVTSKDHWDHLNQNPRLKALEFVASKSRKVMPAQEENEDRFCPAGWTKIGVKMMKALVKWKKQVHVGCFCLFFMNESSINSIQFPSIFPVSMFSSQKECRFIDPILFASFCYLHIYIYISVFHLLLHFNKDADFCRRRIRPRSSRTFPGRWSSPMSSWSSWRAHYLGGRSSDWLVV